MEKSWANFDIEGQNPIQMRSNYFGSFILNTAGLELPPYNCFLLDLMETIPVMGKGGIYDTEGQ